MTRLVVAEMFDAWQGEGPSAGRWATFLRLGGCNLTCTWCDTPYTWDASRFDLRAELTAYDIDGVIESIGDTNLLVITGGEPLLQANQLEVLVDAVGAMTEIEIETNGTLAPPNWWSAVRFNVSPKLHNAGASSMLHRGWLAERSIFKFVVTDPSDLLEVDALNLPVDRVWIMPEGTDAEAILDLARHIAPEVAKRGYNLTLRQHVLLYGNERGR